MEAWRVMAWTAGLLVLWAVLVSVLGFDIDPLSVVVAAVFGMVGFYLSARFAERFTAEETDE